MAVTLEDRFAATCSVVIGNNYDTCGTLTRASIESLAPDQLADIFLPGGLYADHAAWFKTSIEMKACGIQRNGFYDWIMGSKDLNQGRKLLSFQKIQRNPNVMFPFILARQQSVINSDHWYISAGYAPGSYTPGAGFPLTAGQKTAANAEDSGYRIIRIATHNGIDLDPAWFNPRDAIQIFSRSSTGQAEDGQWKVLASAVATDGTFIDVAISSQNAGSSLNYDATPTDGVVLRGINNVNDFEQFCLNRPVIDGRKIVPFWIQTRRRSRCVSSSYREVVERLMTGGVNAAFREFGELTLAQKNAQDEARDQRDFVVSFLFNKPLNADQTLNRWQDLPDILTPTGFSIDPGTGAEVVAKRANFIGVQPQLQECGRVKDLFNQALNMDEFLQANYEIMRARESQGRTVTDIDWYTDSQYAVSFFKGYIAYCENLYGDKWRLTSEVEDGANAMLGMAWKSYKFAYPAGVRINIITHKTFDDFRNANYVQGQDTRGVLLLALDIGAGGGIYYSLIASNRKVHTTGELEKLAQLDASYACVMETITKEQTLISETGTVVVECPYNSLWLQNIKDVPPTVGGPSGDYHDLYTSPEE